MTNIYKATEVIQQEITVARTRVIAVEMER